VTNYYDSPNSEVEGEDQENNSGRNEESFPDGVKGWSWGGFLLGWLWAIFNKTWIGLLALVPYIGLLVSIYLGVKGRELAWKNKRWDSVAHFDRVQRNWAMWGGIVIFVALLGSFYIAATGNY